MIRPAGAGHSFSGLVPCDGALVFLDNLSGVVGVDAASLQAEVFAGTRLGQLGPALDAHGQAMPNLPDIDYQTLGGAIATSTHGTGALLGSLSSCVVGLSLATPGGELLECDATRNAEVFHAARTSLGALGVVTRVRLQNAAPFDVVEKTAWRDLDDVLAGVARSRDENRCFEFYAFPHADVALEITTNETDAEPYAIGSDDPDGLSLLQTLFDLTRWLPGIGTPVYDALLRRSGTTEHAGPSYRVLTHPRTTRFNEMEYTVPAEAGPGVSARGAAHDPRARPSDLLSDRVPLRARGRRVALDVLPPRGLLDLGAPVRGPGLRRVLRRGRAGVLEVRGPPALGQAPRARRRAARGDLPALPRVPRRAPRARSARADS